MNPEWQNLTDPIFHWAAERPHAPAFHEGPVTLTYGELAPLVGRAAVYLDRLGIRAGDRVAINLTNSIDHFILTLGLLRVGATTLEIAYDPARALSPDQLAKLSIRTVFLEPTANPVAGVATIRVDAAWRGLIERERGDFRHPGGGDEIFTLSMTSGTTGEPKAILSSHRQSFRHTRANIELYAGSGVFSPERPAKLLLTASIAFAVFFRVMLSRLAIGGAVVILPAFLHVIDLVKAIGLWDDAVCYVPAAMCRVLIACAPQQGFLFPRLRALVATGGFLYAQDKLAVLDRVTPHFYESYGASGIGVVSVLPPQEMRRRPASVGRPSSMIEAQVVDENARPLPAGAVGRLRYRSTEASGRAGEREAAGDEQFREGWWYPGDYGHIDEAGYIFLTGRATEVIKRKGEALFAPDIEAVIAAHPSVAEVAVVGVPGAQSGEGLVALVVPRGKAQHEALARHCRSRLPPERWPDRVFYAQALPKTAAGKLDRRRVTELVMAEINRRGRRAR